MTVDVNSWRDIYSIVFPVLGLGILLWGIWWTRPKRPLVEQTKEQLTPSWLAQILKGDKANLSNILYGRDYIWSFDGLKNVDSFIEMTMTLINAAAFPILVIGAKGRFLIEEQECAQAAEMEGRTRIHHGEAVGIRIKQRLSQEMVNLIIGRKMHQVPLRISLKLCQIVVQPEITGEQSEPSDISLGRDQNVPIPE